MTAVVLAGSAFFQFKDQFPGQFFEDTIALKEWFSKQNFDDTVFYLKGSRGMALEKILNDEF